MSAAPAIKPASRQLQWINPPQQARSQETLERLLDAAEELIEERGFENISVAEITRKARSSVGAFYSRFKDKQGLLHYLHERFSQQAAATARDALDPARWEGVGVHEICRELVQFLVELYSRRGGLILTFQSHIRSDSEIAARMLANNMTVTSLLFALLSRKREEIGHPNPELAVALATRLIFGSLNERALVSHVLPEALNYDDETIVNELTRAFTAYLGVKDPG